MFGLSVATGLIQGSTERTWNCVLNFASLLWSKINHIKQNSMPKSRKRHHSRSRSRSRSQSRDREDKYKRYDSYEKDRDGKRRKVDSYESPPHKRSLSEDTETEDQENVAKVPIVEESLKKCPSSSGSKSISQENETEKHDTDDKKTLAQVSSDGHTEKSNESQNVQGTVDEIDMKCIDDKSEEVKVQEGNCVSLHGHTEKSNDALQSVCTENVTETNSLGRHQTVSSEGCSEKSNEQQEKNDLSKTTSKMAVDDLEAEINTLQTADSLLIDDSPTKVEPSKEGSTVHKSKAKLDVTPNRVLSPKQLKKKLDSDKKRMEKQKEKEEREKKKNEERERVKQEKLKKIEERQKEKQLKIDQKKKEKEEKEEQKRKEREEKEKMRKEREEREEQKRKEREQEKLKKQQEIEEKNREKQKEEEKKQKAAMAFVNFFVPVKSDVAAEEEKYVDDRQAFKTFEVKSDMKLAPLRRKCLTEKELSVLDRYLEEPDETVSYLAELKQDKLIGTSSKTWPVEDILDNDDVVCLESDSDLGETVNEDKKQKFRAKFLKFHDNRRPAYFGTWRKHSRYIKPRKPFVEDTDYFNYEEDSDDDWEEEEQGESLNGSDDEADKENEDEKDDYEIDNDFFVPHGHLSDDEIDDEEEARLAPELMKQKLKLLKDEFELDMKSKTHKLKPRYIGCVWYNKDGSNVDEAIDRYLKPLAMMAEGQIVIKARHTVLTSRREKPAKALDPQYMPIFIKVIHGNTNNQKVLIEEFLTLMANTGHTVEMSKSDLIKNLKNTATWKKCKDGSLKNKYCWLINEGLQEQYGVDLK